MNRLVRNVIAITVGFLIGSALSYAAPTPILVSSDNVVQFSGTVTRDSVSKVMAKLHEIEKNRKDIGKPIYLVINSGGGSVYAGNVFIEYAKTIKNLHTITIFAASMAHAIVQSLPGIRYVTEHGLFMAHRAKGSFQGQFNSGEVESQLKLWTSIITNMETKASSRIGISLLKYKAKIKDEWWSTANEAIRENVADEVVKMICTHELVDNKLVEEHRNMFGAVRVTFSSCPLFQYPLSIERIQNESEESESKTEK